MILAHSAERTWKFVAALFLVSVLPSCANAQDPVAIVGVDVIPMDSERVLRDQTVVIADGRIRLLGAAGEVVIPDGTRRIDGAGRYLIPGLADMHVHPRSERDLSLLLANGITFVRIMAGQPRFMGWRDEIAAGRRLGPRLHVAGPIIESPPPPELASVIPTAGKILIETRAEGVAEVARQAEAGYDFIKVYNNLSLRAYEGVMAESARRGLAVTGHVPFEVGIEGALAAGQTSIEHLRGYIWKLVPADAPQGPGADLRSRVLAWQYADPDLTRNLAAQTALSGAWNCPTLTTRIYTLPGDQVDAYLARPASAYLPSGTKARLVDRSLIGWLSNFSEQDFEQATEADRVQNALIRGLRDAGAGILAGTDIPPFGFSLHRELELLVEAGLTPFEALEAATTSPAAFVDAVGELGVVRVGAHADLVLLERNPLADIAATRSIEGVIVGGRWLPRPALDEMLRAAISPAP